LLYIEFAQKEVKYASLINYSELIEKTSELIKVLVANELLEEHKEVDGYYEITRKGHSLRMQKNLKRISLQKANDYLSKLLVAISIINKENQYYQIDAILLYGSVIRKEENVGDIDLSLVFSAKDTMSSRKMNYQGKHEEQRKIIRQLRISPYLSFTEWFSLVCMYEEGECDLNIIYVADDKCTKLFEELKTTKQEIPVYNI
jgi:predicted transcriptional regulator